MSETSIEWTDSTWNPVTGCSKISAGCLHCYAEIMTRRLKAMGQPNYKMGFRVACHEHMLDRPLTWRKPKNVFVNSMSDVFHEEVPLEFITRVFEVMRKAPQHRFQLLTKRAERMVELSDHLTWPKNVWMGVTVEHSDYVERIDLLRRTPAAVKFLSLEPLLSGLPRLNLQGIDWVIVGGESGPGARRMEESWVDGIQQCCQRQGVPFFFKQWGGVQKKAAGRVLNGRTYDEMPVGAGI
jgi:protein gp37